MKKLLLFVLTILIIAFISIYFIIPEKLVVKAETQIYANDNDVAKFITQKKGWAKWWPGQLNKADTNMLVNNGTHYILQKGTNSQMQVLIGTKYKFNSNVTYLQTADGITTVTWFTQKQTSLNPIKRINDLIQIKKINNETTGLLVHLKQFMQSDINIYGIKISLSKVKDTVMLATVGTSTSYPTPEFIYRLINKLKQQTDKQQAKITNYPMLNINQTGAEEFQVMVALPLDKQITPGANNVINKMVLGGNILETNVKGGRFNITNAFTQMKNYQKDHHLVSPAMPFEQLITNRLAEKDTTKWITKIFYPIF